MKKDIEKENILHDLQVLEQNFHQTLLQKQAFQMELRETQAAKKELEKAGDEVFKIVGQLMIKTDKKSTVAELENKEKLIDLRVKNLEKQEKMISDKIEAFQKEISK